MNAEIINCFSTATVTGNSDAGGIVGMFNSSKLYNCYSRATVSVNTKSAGGLCGSMNTSLDTANPVMVDNVYSAATVTGAKYVGCITGWDEGSSSKTPVYMTNVYFCSDINPSGNYAEREATKLTKAQATDGTLLAFLCNNTQSEYVLWTQGNDSNPLLFFKADFDEDGIITVKDVLAVLRAIVNGESIDKRYGRTTALDVIHIVKKITK